MSAETLEPGDIVLSYRRQYKGPFKYLVTRLILFFTTAWWKGESTSKVYHAEMVVKSLSDKEFQVVTMEPMKCRYKTRSYNRKRILRLNLKGPFFNNAFEQYVQEKFGQKYDYLKLIQIILYWMFLGWNWLGRIYKNSDRDICSEFVARFYERVGIVCSTVDADITTPDDIYDMTSHAIFYKVVFDAKGDYGKQTSMG